MITEDILMRPKQFHFQHMLLARGVTYRSFKEELAHHVLCRAANMKACCSHVLSSKIIQSGLEG